MRKPTDKKPALQPTKPAEDRFVNLGGRQFTWTPEEIKKLKSLNRRGLTYSEMVPHFEGRTFHQIHYAIKKLGIVYNGDIHEKSRENERRFKQDSEKIIAEYYSGCTIRDLAKKYDYPRTALERYLRGQGLKRLKSQLDDEKKGIIKQYFGQGCLCNCIANRIGMSAAAVRLYLEREGFDPDEVYHDHSIIRELHNAGLTIEQIAVKLELPVRTVAHNLTPRPRREKHVFTADEDKQIVAWRAQGYSIDTIAKTLGVSYDQLYSHVRRLAARDKR